MIGLISAEISRAFRDRLAWLIAAAGVLFCGLGGSFIWSGKGITSTSSLEELQLAGDTVGAAFTLFTLFCVPIGTLAVTSDYSSKMIGRIRRTASIPVVMVSKSLSAGLFCAATNILAIIASMVAALAALPSGQEFASNVPIWQMVAGSLLCSFLMTLFGCAIGFSIRAWLPAVLVAMAAVFGSFAMDGTEVGKYLCWGPLVSSFTNDPDQPIRLPFWAAVLDLGGICLVVYVVAFVVLSLRKSVT